MKETLKKYLKTPITTAKEYGEKASTKFSIITLAIFLAYTFILKIFTAWKTSTLGLSIFKDPTIGEKFEAYFDYLFERDGLISILKGSLITVIIFAVFILFLFLALKVFKKEDANYLKLSTTILLTNLYIVPINIVLGILGMFKVKFFIYLVAFLTIIYVIGLLILNVFTIYTLLQEENADNAFRIFMSAIVGLVVLFAIILFLFGDNIKGVSEIKALTSLFDIPTTSSSSSKKKNNKTYDYSDYLDNFDFDY